MSNQIEMLEAVTSSISQNSAPLGGPPFVEQDNDNPRANGNAKVSNKAENLRAVGLRDGLAVISPTGEIVERWAQPDPENSNFERLSHWALQQLADTGCAAQTHLFLHLATKSIWRKSRDGEPGYYEVLQVSQQELAESLHVSKATISRWLNKLETAGWITGYAVRKSSKPGTSHNDQKAYVVHCLYNGDDAVSSRGKRKSPVLIQATSTMPGVSVEGGKPTTTEPVAKTLERPASTEPVANMKQPVAEVKQPVAEMTTLLSISNKTERQQDQSVGVGVITEAQLTRLERTLQGAKKQAVLNAFGIGSLSELGKQQASRLIDWTDGKENELGNRVQIELHRMNRAAIQGDAEQLAVPRWGELLAKHSPAETVEQAEHDLFGGANDPANGDRPYKGLLQRTRITLNEALRNEYTEHAICELITLNSARERRTALSEVLQEINAIQPAQNDGISEVSHLSVEARTTLSVGTAMSPDFFEALTRAAGRGN